MDGLPHIGGVVWPGQHYYSNVDNLTGKVKFGKLKGEETALVDQVTVIGGKEKEISKVNIRMRYNRNPVIGRLGAQSTMGDRVLDTRWPLIVATTLRH